MRFSRDKRGYENTFVVHGERRRGKGRSRLLYWFRTPPGVKVGRAALDEDAIRLIEELNPEIVFDWTRILKGGMERPDERRPDDRRSEDRRSQGQRQSFRSVGSPGRRPPQAPGPQHPAPAGQPAVEAALPKSPAEATSQPVADELLPAGGDDRETGPPPGVFLAPPPTPAHARLGGEGVSRLRGRYAEIMARISERVVDESRREELKSRAERLNPDTWVTEAEVKAGLEEYEGVFESLRAVVGRRKRRRRRGARPSQPGDQAGGEPVAGGLEPSSREHENDGEDL